MYGGDHLILAVNLKDNMHDSSYPAYQPTSQAPSHLQVGFSSWRPVFLSLQAARCGNGGPLSQG